MEVHLSCALLCVQKVPERVFQFCRHFSSRRKVTRFPNIQLPWLKACRSTRVRVFCNSDLDGVAFVMLSPFRVCIFAFAIPRS